MIKVMLEAVSDMLNPPVKNEETIVEFAIRVSCAKTILDKVIEGLGLDAIPPEPDPILESLKVLPEHHLEKKEKIPTGKYKIVKDDSNKIVRIVNLPLANLVELDGKTMTHKEAIGKTFISGRIL